MNRVPAVSNRIAPVSKIENVRVFARFRPLSSSEEVEREQSESKKPDSGIPFSSEDGLQKYRPLIVNPDGIENVVTVGESAFKFTEVFGVKSKQSAVCSSMLRHLVDHVSKGYNVSVLAYGQSGSGKTHTMYGPDDDPGLVFAMLNSLCELKNVISKELKVSVMELYNKELYDLHSADMITQRSSEATVQRAINRVCPDFRWYNVSSFLEIREILQVCSQRRTVAETKLNRFSSRGHMLVAIQVPLSCDEKQGTKLLATVKLVDLCGSENVTKSGAKGDNFREAVNINTSLHQLGLAVKNINDHAVVDYRSDPLTRLLKDALGGNSLTSVVVCCSPSEYNRRETVYTLNFGLSMQKVTNKLKAKEILTYEESLRRLRLAEARIAYLEELNENLRQFIERSGLEVPKNLLKPPVFAIDPASSIRSNSSSVSDTEPSPSSKLPSLFALPPPVKQVNELTFAAVNILSVEEEEKEEKNDKKTETRTTVATIAIQTDADLRPFGVRYRETLTSKPPTTDAACSPVKEMREKDPDSFFSDKSRTPSPKPEKVSEPSMPIETAVNPAQEEEQEDDSKSSIDSWGDSPRKPSPPIRSCMPPISIQELKDAKIAIPSEELLTSRRAMLQKRAMRYATMNSSTIQKLVEGKTGNQKTFAALQMATSSEWESMVNEAKKHQQKLADPTYNPRLDEAEQRALRREPVEPPQSLFQIAVSPETKTLLQDIDIDTSVRIMRSLFVKVTRLEKQLNLLK